MNTMFVQSSLKTFALIVYAHPYRNSYRNGARAKDEIYSHEGMVAVALNLLRFNSLKWSVTPTFFLDRWFSILILDRLRKNEQKNQCRKFKIFPFFYSRDI